MGQLFSRLVVAAGLVTLACATAVEEGPPVADHLGEGTSGTANNTAGTLASAGNMTGSAGTSSSAGTTSTSGGKGGSGPNAFGGTATSGGAGGGSKGGTSSGGASAGSSSGGKAGAASGGSATAGSATGGTASAGTASGGSGMAGSTSATCNGVPDWTSKTYALGDTVASTCSGVFAGGCAMGQSHKFECNPMAGTAALPGCMSREPGVGNGWGEAWVDKGQCQ
jgi:hypothetical protein